MLRWLGHVAKLLQDRNPHIALLAHYPRGHPWHSFVATMKGDFLVVGIPIHGGEWYKQAQDTDFWRPMVQGFKFKS
jgi:hypothetical protein